MMTQKKKLYIHMGSDKTGSTAIQRSLYVNRNSLASSGVYIPLTFLDPIGAHGPLFEELSGVNLNRIADEIVSCPQDRALISWEGIYMLNRSQRKLLSMLGEQFDLTFILYVRNQAEQIQSGILQQVKTGASRFDPLKTRRIILKPRIRDYYGVLRRWRRTFAQSKFLVRPYAREQLVNGDIVEDFLAAIDVLPGDDFVRLKEETNPSLDFYSVIALNQIDAAKKLRPDQRLELVSQLLDYCQAGRHREKFILTQKEVIAIMRYYRRSNTKLIEKYQIPAEVFFNKKIIWRAAGLKLEDCLENLSVIYKELDGLTRHSPWDGPLAGERLQQVLRSGWSEVESGGIWSTGKASELEISRFEPNRYTSYELSIRGRYAPTVPGTTAIALNGHDLGMVDLSSANLTIKASDFDNDGIATLTFTHQHTVVPSELNLNDDNREISFLLTRFNLRGTDAHS